MTGEGKKEEEKNENDATNDNNVSPRMSGRLGIRHLQVFLLFFGMIIGYSLRVSMSVAVVAMSNSTTANPNFERYDWDTSQRSMILSSFFWGYIITQVPSGYAASAWSGRKLLSLGMALCGLLHLLTPIAAHYGNFTAVCACRVGMGLCQGSLLPCVQTFLSKWAPPSERARLGTFAYAGAQFGTVIVLPISGWLAASNVGWPSIFYVFGASAIIWAIAFFIGASDTPATHRSISDREKKYIEESLQVSEDNSKRGLKTPWKEIFTSAPMWALIIAHCGQNWGYWMLLTEIPTYMNDVLIFDIKKNGMMSALPYLAMWILSFPVSWLSDYGLKKGVTRATTRKVSNTIAHWGPAVALIALGLMPRADPTWAVVILVIAVGLNAGSLCGFQINHIDLSPNFAGTMMSITNCIASIVAILAPLIAGMIVTEPSSVYQWSIVFYISAVIYFVGNLIFLIFGKAEVQWWNDTEEVKQRQENRRKSVIA